MSHIFGIHVISSVLENDPARLKKIIVDGKRHDEKLQNILQLAQRAGVPIEHVDKQCLEKIVGSVIHQGVVAEAKPRKSLDESDLETLLTNLNKPAFLLILDGVQDPHNLGACLRSADAAGVDAIIAPKDNSVSITAVTEKVACGAAETTPFIQVTNLARTMRNLKEKGIWCYGLSDKAKQVFYQADLTGNIALVMGAEGKGIRQNVMKQCDVLYSIPMQGSVSSLNVSVATGICLFEALRQRWS